MTWMRLIPLAVIENLFWVHCVGETVLPLQIVLAQGLIETLSVTVANSTWTLWTPWTLLNVRFEIREATEPTTVGLGSAESEIFWRH